MRASSPTNTPVKRPGHPQLSALRLRFEKIALTGTLAVIVIGATSALLLATLNVFDGNSIMLAAAAIALAASPLMWWFRQHASISVMCLVFLFAVASSVREGLIFSVGPIYFGTLFLVISSSLTRALGFLSATAATLVSLALLGVVTADVGTWVRWPLLLLMLAGLTWALSRIFGRITDVLYERDQAIFAANEVRDALAVKHVNQDLMFGMISHELRAPIARLSLLGARNDADSELKRARAVRQLVSVLERMRQIIDPDYQPPLTRQPTVLARLLQDIVIDTAESAEVAGIAVTTQVEGLFEFPLVLNAEGLRSILTNGIENAIRHARATRIHVSISGDEHHIRLSIEDDGQGFDRDSLASLHKPWTRGADSKGTDGLGLGLHIISQAADAMCGTMALQASDMGGAALVVEVAGEMSSAAPTPAARDQLEGVHIGLLDDDTVLGELTAHSLRALGATVDYFSTPEAALAAVKTHTPDLMVVDHFMPVMSGAEWIEAAKRAGFNRPILGLTGALLISGTHPLIKAGATDVLEKPINMAQLLKVVDRLNLTAP